MKHITLAATLLAVVVGIVVMPAAAAAPAAPVSTAPPAVSGDPYVGKALTTTTGGWQNSPTSYSYQWVRCDQNGNGCSQISGATSKTYTPTSADVNHALAAWVTATNAGGTAGPVSSKPTDAITPALAPTSKTKPTIVGKPAVGAKLVATPGKYSGGAVKTFAYQWQRCAKGTTTCTDIAGATSQTYTVTKTDAGQAFRVEVTASNPFGKTVTASNTTDAATVPVTTVTTTLIRSSASTVCCQATRLRGTVSPAKAGERITILARAVDDIASYPVATTTTDANGYWSVTVTPSIQTEYMAQTTTSTTEGAWVYVHPRVGFGIRGKTFIAKVTGRDSFAGSIAWVQAQRANGSWRRIAKVVINQYSVARFHVNLRPHTTYHLRIYLPKVQAGVGYLNGLSMTRRVRFSH
jgi:hypothetical protein